MEYDFKGRIGKNKDITNYNGSVKLTYVQYEGHQTSFDFKITIDKKKAIEISFL